MRHFMPNLQATHNTIFIDSTHGRTGLCDIGAEMNTDKSPFSLESACCRHRKGYTAVYEMLLSPLRGKKINFLEIGIEAGASIRMWERYFTHADLFAFEYFQEKIDHCSKLVTKTKILKTDAGSKEALDETFRAAGASFDVVIDDSSHELEHQRNIIATAPKYIKSGGVLIIEDLYRNDPEDIFDGVIEDHFSFSTFVICHHDNRVCENNDKLWYGVRK